MFNLFVGSIFAAAASFAALSGLIVPGWVGSDLAALGLALSGGVAIASASAMDA